MLVSDGQETCDADPCATAAALVWQGIDLKFDVIGLRVSGRARDQLRCIADQGRALNLSLGTISGFGCGSGSALVANVAGTRRLVSAEANSWQPDEAACQRDGELLLRAGQPLRGLSGRWLELVVVEEPALATPTNLDPVQPSPHWVRMRPGRPTAPPPPGLSLSDAPAVRPGTYAGSVLTGEKQVFAVDLDWGQRLQAQVLVAPRTGALAQALGSDDSLELQLVGAMRGVYDSGEVPGQPTDTPTMLTDDATYRVSAATPTIRYRNRADLDLAPAGLPGPQYVVISKSRLTQEKEFLVPYTLVLGVSGTAGRGALRYASAATPSPTSGPSGSTPVPAPAPTTPDPADEDSPRTAAILTSSVLVLGAVATVVAVRRRRWPRADSAYRQRR